MGNANATQAGKGRNAVCGMMNVKSLTAMDMDTALMESAPVFMDSKANFVTKVRFFNFSDFFFVLLICFGSYLLPVYQLI